MRMTGARDAEEGPFFTPLVYNKGMEGCGRMDVEARVESPFMISQSLIRREELAAWRNYGKRSQVFQVT